MLWNSETADQTCLTVTIAVRRKMQRHFHIFVSKLVRVEGTSLVEKGIQIALRYLENKLTRLINRGVLIKLTQSQNNYSNLHFYCSTLVFNIYFFEFAKLLGGPGPPRPLPTLRHCIGHFFYFSISREV